MKFFKRTFGPLLREYQIFYLTWALREMPKLHPDVPKNVVRLNTLIGQR